MQVFVGDDTWAKLFPSQFMQSKPFPSFNLHDFDTVDDGVWQVRPTAVSHLTFVFYRLHSQQCRSLDCQAPFL